MKRTGFLALAAALSLGALTVSPDAHATGVVQRGQFCTVVAAARCTDDATALSHGHTAIYWIALDNRNGAEVHLTIVWKLNGREVHRQNIVTRGRSTWAMQPLRSGSNTVAVSILDESGAELHTDEATVTH